MFKSSDGSNRWSAVNIDLRDVRLMTIALDAANPEIIYDTDGSSIFASYGEKRQGGHGECLLLSIHEFDTLRP